MMQLREYNHNHGPDGKFAAGPGGAGSAPWTSPSSGEVVAPVSRKDFVRAMTAARAVNPHAAFVSQQTPGSLKRAGATCYTMAGGKAGYYLTKEGYVGGLFSDGSIKNVGRQLLLHEVEHGAKTLDCYSGEAGKRGFLDSMYAEFGFKETARYPWNEAYRPPGWSTSAGTPDYVYMEYQGGNRKTVRDRHQKGVDLQEGKQRRPEPRDWESEDCMAGPWIPLDERRRQLSLREARAALLALEVGR